MKKRGMSGVLAIVLIVLLALAAIAIVWLFVKVVLDDGGRADPEVELLITRYSLLPKTLEVTDDQNISFILEKEEGPGEESCYVIVLRDTYGRTAVFTFEHVELEKLGRKKVDLRSEDYNLGGNITLIEIYACVDYDGDFLTGREPTDEYFLGDFDFVDCVIDEDCPGHGGYCNGGVNCVEGICDYGTSPNCNDGIGCTDDSCNEGTDSCDHVVNNVNCDDNVFCNGAETCHATLDCQAGSDPCPGQSCDEVGGSCVECLVDADCDIDGLACSEDFCDQVTYSCGLLGYTCTCPLGTDEECEDGLYCNGEETCVAGDCVVGSDPCPGQMCNDVTDTCVDCLGDGDCVDGVSCTDDTCVGGNCNNAANDANCPDDGDDCNGINTCDILSDCQPGTPMDCDDGVGCTDDGCFDSACDNVENDDSCIDALFCNGVESCHITLDCQAGSDPCPGESCDEGSDSCVGCLGDGDCDDSYSCTSDTCSGGSCSYVENDAACVNGDWCDGIETCDPSDPARNPVTGCISGSDPCFGDPCYEPGDTCGECGLDSECDDGVWCNGDEFCAGGRCHDGIRPCIDDAGCDEGSDSCIACTSGVPGTNDPTCPSTPSSPNYNNCIGGNCNYVYQYYRVFVTNGLFDGNLGGLEGADARCQNIAESRSLGGIWEAWLADDGESPVARFDYGTDIEPFELLNRDLVADDMADLVDGDSLYNAINRNEFNAGVSGEERVWTGVLGDGNIAGAKCNNWISDNNAHNGADGRRVRTDSGWTYVGSSSCSADRRLYCFEQPL